MMLAFQGGVYRSAMCCKSSGDTDWVTLHKPKERCFASVSVIAVTRKETVRTPKDPDRCLGFGTIELG